MLDNTIALAIVRYHHPAEGTELIACDGVNIVKNLPFFNGLD